MLIVVMLNYDHTYLCTYLYIFIDVCFNFKCKEVMWQKLHDGFQFIIL